MEDGRILLKPQRDDSFKKGLSNEPNFGRILFVPGSGVPNPGPDPVLSHHQAKKSRKSLILPNVLRHFTNLIYLRTDVKLHTVSKKQGNILKDRKQKHDPDSESSVRIRESVSISKRHLHF
jgi:hypothetical protein